MADVEERVQAFLTRFDTVYRSHGFMGIFARGSCKDRSVLLPLCVKEFGQRILMYDVQSRAVISRPLCGSNINMIVDECVLS